MPRFREVVPVDDYVLDVLMRDLVGHDQRPAAYLVYLCLYGLAARTCWRPVKASLRQLADATGLSKSAAHTALVTLRRRDRDNLVPCDRDPRAPRAASLALIAQDVSPIT